ncbi:SsrA-binding protein [Mycoplasma zalophi]|uniref:SsrA-binding protein n=1 Tax=Mycoplasma zalophi TaxID=191287 RepID=A0ABS6DR50_9MOLU|nr:SsrA-binding protein [Mycoplasma zalophi]MBU4690887.1 SsrA-binding protein [Mycoplasma zalophi]MBU4692320.1 SsrA-binding protein [Mycoplasma zalophi]MCU4117213.1 SsrA-binding protein [Mycoplasma zalophi]
MKIIAKNKFQKSEYNVLDTYECGISLEGWEVKSIRQGNVNLKNAFCSIKNSEMWINNMHISQYMLVKGDSERPRKLLLHKNEIYRIMSKKDQLSLQIIPSMIYWKENHIKVEILLVKHLKIHDKRQKIIKKEQEMKMKKILNSYK